jgi:hypothetical protein
MNDGSKYDLIVKDLFQRDHPSLLEQLLPSWLCGRS